MRRDIGNLSGLGVIDRVVVHNLRKRFGTATGSYFQDRSDVNIRQLFGDSATFDYSAAIDGPLDLVYIDAAHDYLHKKIDTENALRMLSDRGVIVWHNYADVLNPEVTEYLSIWQGVAARSSTCAARCSPCMSQTMHLADGANR